MSGPKKWTKCATTKNHNPCTANALFINICCCSCNVSSSTDGTGSTLHWSEWNAHNKNDESSGWLPWPIYFKVTHTHRCSKGFSNDAWVFPLLSGFLPRDLCSTIWSLPLSQPLYQWRFNCRYEWKIFLNDF